jgi:transposase
MSMAQYGDLLILSNDERDELTRWTRSRSLPAGDVFRARLILALADGLSYREIEKRVHTSSPTIARWRQRFEQHRIEGLNPRHKGSRPRVVTPAVQARIVRRTLEPPPDGSTHWTCRKLAKAVGVSKLTVQRVWTQAQLKPHRLDRYMASNDPELETKAADVIGLYLNPPQHAAVFCVDEKTAMQALDRLVPVLPLSPGRAERHGFEYYRLSAHKTKAVEQFLEQNPRVRFHFTPTYSSWLNQVELWFAKIQRDVIDRGVFTSVADLARKLRRYIRAYEKSARPFRWTYTDPQRRIRTNQLTGTAH